MSTWGDNLRWRDEYKELLKLADDHNYEQLQIELEKSFIRMWEVSRDQHIVNKDFSNQAATRFGFIDAKYFTAETLYCLIQDRPFLEGKLHIKTISCRDSAFIV